MTAPTYDNLTSDDTGADKILTTGTVVALDQNPVSVAQRGTSAPLVQPFVREWKTSGTGATWTIPAGVTAWNEIIIGGGAGANGGTTVAGTASSTTYDSLTVTAPGGTNSGAASNGGAIPTNGDLNLPGQAGWIPASGAVKGGDTPLGFGFGSIGTGPGSGFGGGGALVATDSAGGSGSVAIKRRVRVTGQNSVTYTVGVGGNASQDGADGLIVFEY